MLKGLKRFVDNGMIKYCDNSDMCCRNVLLSNLIVMNMILKTKDVYMCCDVYRVS